MICWAEGFRLGKLTIGGHFPVVKVKGVTVVLVALIFNLRSLKSTLLHAPHR